MGRNFALKLPQMRKAAELYLDGHSRREVAKRLRCTDSAVRSALRVMNVKPRPQPSATVLANKRRAKPAKASAFRPAHTEMGRWVWMNPANADHWKSTEQRA